MSPRSHACTHRNALFLEKGVISDLQKKSSCILKRKKYGGDSGAGTTMFAKALPFRKKSDVLLKRVYKEMLSVKYV